MKGLARVFLNLAAVLGFSKGPVLREDTKNQEQKRDALEGFLGQFRGRGFPRRRAYYLPKGDWTVTLPDCKLDPIQRARVEQGEEARRKAKELRRVKGWARTCATRPLQPLLREHSPGLLPATHARRSEIVGRRLARSERRAARLAVS